MNDFKIWLTYWYGVPTMPDNRIEKIKQAGFKYLSLHWCDEYESANGKKEVIIDKCKERGLQIGIFHLPFENANDLWKDDNSGKQLFSIYKTCLSDASNYNVEYVVMHLNSNSKKLQNIEIGITRIKKLLELASKLNVNIAFENLPDDDYLEQIEELLKNYPNACLCFDIGHNNIKYSKFMCSHKEKIQVMHIHDNIGKKDTHQIPFTGTINWEEIYSIIREINNHCMFVFEVQKNSSENEIEFLDKSFLAYQKMKKDIERGK